MSPQHAPHATARVSHSRRRARRAPAARVLLAGAFAALAASAAAIAAPPEAADTRVGTAGVDVAALRRRAVAFEHGDGVAKDGALAAALYCEAARAGDAASQYDLGWMYANGRGVARDDAVAAFFFERAAAQGIAQARRMLALTGAATDATPACMREPDVAAAAPPVPVARADPPPPPLAPAPIVALVRAIAPEYRVPVPLVWAIMAAESNFDARAVSPRNAQGLMQLIPDTAARFRVRNPFDPAQNVRGGIAYLRWLLAYFEGDVALVAAAYNAGEGAVERFGGVPPYAETRAYVRRIVAEVGAAPHPFDASVTGPSAALERIRARRAR